MTDAEDKRFMADVVTTMRGQMLASTSATPAELDAMHADIESAARDPRWTFHQTRIHQVWGRRP